MMYIEDIEYVHCIKTRSLRTDDYRRTAGNARISPAQDSDRKSRVLSHKRRIQKVLCRL